MAEVFVLLLGRDRPVHGLRRRLNGAVVCTAGSSRWAGPQRVVVAVLRSRWPRRVSRLRRHAPGHLDHHETRDVPSFVVTLGGPARLRPACLLFILDQRDAGTSSRRRRWRSTCNNIGDRRHGQRLPQSRPLTWVVMIVVVALIVRVCRAVLQRLRAGPPVGRATGLVTPPIALSLLKGGRGGRSQRVVGRRRSANLNRGRNFTVHPRVCPWPSSSFSLIVLAICDVPAVPDPLRAVHVYADGR